MKSSLNSIWLKTILAFCVLACHTQLYSQTNIWLGLTTNWDEGTNWSLGHVPANPETVHIPVAPNQPTIVNVTIIPGRTTGNIIIDAGAVLTVENQLNFMGTSWQGASTGLATVQGNSYVHITGITPAIFSGNTQFDNLVQDDLSGLSTITGNVYIMKELMLEGSNMEISGSLTFRSTSPNQYGMLVNFGTCCTGVVSAINGGVVKSEIYVGSSGYHQMGATSIVALSQLGANGTSGYYIPSPNYSPCDERYSAPNSPQSTLWSWDESHPNNSSCFQVGWHGEAAGTMATPGKGYMATYSAGSVVTITGTPNQAANYTVPGLINSNWSSYSQQLQAPYYYASGWHLLANPYQASYHIASSLNSDFDDAVIYQSMGGMAGTYQPLIVPSIYTGPSVVNYGFIAPAQAVMVHKTPGAAADFVFDIDNCDPSQHPDFYKTEEVTGKGLIVVVEGNSFKDITMVGFSQDATTGFDVTLDSRKMKSGAGQPTLFTVNNGQFLAVNTNKSMLETPLVDMPFSAGVDGSFTMSFEGIENFDAADGILLEDKKTGQIIDAKQINNYTFTSNTADDLNRFALHFATPTAIREASEQTLRMFSSGNTLFIDFSKLTAPDATIDVFDVLGRSLLSEKYGTSTIYSKEFNNVDGGYVIAKVTAGGDVHTGKVFLAAAK